MEKRNDKAMAELGLIEAQANILQDQIGYWNDLKWVQTDSAYKLGRIASTQSPEIAEKLKIWGQKWGIT